MFTTGRSGEWLQVDLKAPTKITGVITQGSGKNTQYVQTFKVAYGNSSVSNIIQNGDSQDTVLYTSIISVIFLHTVIFFGNL